MVDEGPPDPDVFALKFLRCFNYHTYHTWANKKLLVATILIVYSFLNNKLGYTVTQFQECGCVCVCVLYI